MCLTVSLLSGCGGGTGVSQAARDNAQTPPSDAAHEGMIGPHGDHTPKHGGLVLMNGDIHYEVILGTDGRHEVWFTDAIRSDLPASVASGVTLEIARPNEPIENVLMQINDTGEAWVARTRPIEGDGVMVKVRYALLGEPYEVEIPFVVSAGATP